jgi:peptidyl-prolyl cis-trans isomerase C
MPRPPALPWSTAMPHAAQRPALPRHCVALLCALSLAAAAGCRKEAEEAPDANAVATVNGEVLSRADFERELAAEVAPELTPQEVEPFKRALLETRVNQLLLLQAARQHNVAVSAEEVDRGVLRLSSDYPEGNLGEALSQGQRSMAELKAQTAARLTIEKLYAEHVYPRVAVTEEELRAYYAAHAADFHEPEQVRAAQLVVKGLEEARRLQKELKEGKKFADLARRYSLSPDARVGGDLGFFARGQMPPEFEEVAFSLRVGQVSDVVSTDYGYHLFRVLERKPARKRELADVRPQVEARLLEHKRLQAQEEYLKGLRSRAKIWVNEPVLQALTVRASGAKLAAP